MLTELTPIEVLVNRERELIEKQEAEIQKKLTKAAGFFSGRLVRELGLRYAPDLRFHKDNTLTHLEAHDEQRDKYLAEAKQDRETNEKVASGELTGFLAQTAKPLYEMLRYLKTYKRLSEGEKIAFLTTIPYEFQDKFVEIMEKNQSSEAAEQQILKMLE